jgi:hypothetical protein
MNQVRVARISLGSSVTNRFLPKSKVQSCFLESPSIAVNEKQYFDTREMPILGSKVGVLVPLPSSPLFAKAGFLMSFDKPISMSLSNLKYISSLGGMQLPDNAFPLSGATFESLVLCFIYFLDWI